ncbi:hypothetical protein PGB90_005053 [Kerria lacca]
MPAELGVALSRIRITPRMRRPGLFNLIAFRSRIRISQYASAVIVVPFGMHLI